MALTQEQRDKIRKLNEYPYLIKEIDRYIRELEKLDSRKYGLGGLISDMPRGGGGSSDPLASCIEDIDSVCADLKDKVEQLREKSDRIYTAISNVKNPHLRELLGLKYIDGLRAEKIMVDKYISRSTYYRWHEEALDSVEI